MKGTYVLLIENDRVRNINIGRLGKLAFIPGYYIYVGSALNNLEKRIQRHCSSNKKIFWHIDYLLEEMEICEVFRIESNHRLECMVAQKFAECFFPVSGFGCSDCKCKSHLFFNEDNRQIKVHMEKIIGEITNKEIRS